MNRKEFLQLAAGAAAFNIGGLAFGQSRPRQIAAGRKIRVALIGCGGRLRSVLVTKCLDEEIVALVDPDAPQTDATKARIKKLKADYDLSKVRTFADYREFLKEMGNSVDAAIIASNQQTHAPIAIACMKRGIHVYVEKPICYSEEEADLLAAAERKYGVVTQAGHHGHSGPFQPLVAEYVQSGALGQIREVWSWSDRFNAQRKLSPVIDPPKGMDWDLWVGPAEMRPYRHSYLGQRWYDIRGFGNGSLGNMGNHVLDAPFWAMNLMETPPTAVTMEDMSYVCPESWPTRETLTYEFPARPGMEPFKLHWTDGIHDDVPIDEDVQYHYAKREWMNFPPIVLELEKKYNSATSAQSLWARRAFSGRASSATPSSSCRSRSRSRFPSRRRSTAASRRARATCTSSSTRSARGARRTRTSWNTPCRSSRRSSSATWWRSPRATASRASSGTARA